MVKDGIVIVADYSQDNSLSIRELMEALQLSQDFMHHLIDYHIIEIHGDRLDAVAIKRIQRAKRLYRDLEINYAGIATILDLLDELEDLRAHTAIIERHILK